MGLGIVDPYGMMSNIKDLEKFFTRLYSYFKDYIFIFYEVSSNIPKILDLGNPDERYKKYYDSDILKKIKGKFLLFFGAN